ncbi:MAG: single-stranded DNA-binding protein [Bacilli bacterium]|nr:single-stranded DNA-binding protein [Bacilli bacterium]
MFNEVIIIGKLASKPELKTTHNGVKMANAIIQVERPYRNNLGIKENDYINCLFWRALAAQVIDCCEVGSLIGVKGRIQSHSYEDDENRSITTFEVKVEHVSFIENYLQNLK